MYKFEIIFTMKTKHVFCWIYDSRNKYKVMVDNKNSFSSQHVRINFFSFLYLSSTIVLERSNIYVTFRNC